MVNVIGAGLAGCEAAYQLANKGIKVKLYEMKPTKKTPAQNSDFFAELVCSNSLRNNSVESAVGILKQELRMFDSLILEAAEANKVPAGGSLSVDREAFAKYITDKVNAHKNIEVINKEVTEIDWESNTIIASGPLTSDDLSAHIKETIGNDYLYFFDAAAPIVEFDSIDMTKAYLKDRWDDDSLGNGAYINCPMNKEEYTVFYNELIKARCIEPKDFELKVFEGCMPIEEMAKRGVQTMLYGPLKPVGLMNGDKKYHAVVQLRQDNAAKTLYNIVGFQTHLAWPEQDRVLSLIPGLENLKIARYGVMHRNTFINAPKMLNKFYQLKEKKNIFFAGQITGVEGYVESTSSGLVAGLNMAKQLNGEELIDFDSTTASGALVNYISNANPHNFQPMNVTFSLFAPLTVEHKKKERKGLYSQRALENIKKYID